MENRFTLFSNHSDKNNSIGELFDPDRFLEPDLNFKIAICITNAFLSLTALLGNSAILITFWKTSSLHSAANILLRSLAVSDLAVGLLVQPFDIANTISGIYAFYFAVTILGPFLTIASFFTITAIAVDRLLALQLHLRYHAVVTPFRVTWIVVFIWVFAGIFASTKYWIASLSQVAISATINSLLVVNFLVYLKIYLVVRRHQRQIQHMHHQQGPNNDILSMKRFKKSAMNTFLVFILLLFSYLPSSFIVYLAFAGVIISRKVFAIVFTLIFLNSSLNPALYCWRDREICTAVKQLFCRWFYAESEAALFLKVGYYDEICICPISAVSVEHEQVVCAGREMPFSNFKYLFFP